MYNNQSTDQAAAANATRQIVVNTEPGTTICINFGANSADIGR